MRRLLPLALLAFAAVALAQSARTVSVTGQLATYRNVTDGGVRPTFPDFSVGNARALDLGNVCGFRVSICSVTGATLTGGTLIPWVYNPSAAEPMSDTDLTLTVGTPIAACRVFPDQLQVARAGSKLIYAPSAITGTDVDAGSLNTDGGNYTIRYDAWTCP